MGPDCKSGPTQYNAQTYTSVLAFPAEAQSRTGALGTKNGSVQKANQAPVSGVSGVLDAVSISPTFSLSGVSGVLLPERTYLVSDFDAAATMSYWVVADAR